MTLKRVLQFSGLILSILFIVSTLAITGHLQAAAHQTNLEYTYRRALDDLATHVSDMNLTLTKANYANTSSQQNGMAGKLMKDAGAAKAALAALPVTNDSLNTVNKFIAQVGDFSSALSSKLSSGETLSEQDRQILHQLSQYCNTLAANLNEIQASVAQQQVSIGQSQALLQNLETAQSPFEDYFLSTAEEFANYPTLIYDGPFSDHMTQKNAEMLQCAPAVSMEQAKQAVAQSLSLDQNALTPAQDTEGSLPVYNFTAQNYRISVTKQGGYLASFVNSRPIETMTLQLQQAKEYARAYLTQLYEEEFAETYYILYNNMCTIQYAYAQNGVVCYPDQIKISVAMDTGEIAEYHANTFLMNHKERTLPTPRIDENAARAQVSSALQIESARMAVIPTTRETEPLCYEFLCRGQNNEQVLVYINSETGMEEQILILIETDEGTLTQ